ncbi:hypothetical protein PROFUN_02157 [Planoprotostelium fungivorum]|uniref:Uncharacterized protein n=1 Tax=Planoprotostelium fungivorum TaxID=1890364 RepID=A0A2P6NZ93_9EUKA|nr:hypothetical protein PROFUN_02157 [Planoprotostelium fungivorum]
MDPGMRHVEFEHRYYHPSYAPDWRAMQQQFPSSQMIYPPAYQPPPKYPRLEQPSTKAPLEDEDAANFVDFVKAAGNQIVREPTSSPPDEPIPAATTTDESAKPAITEEEEDIDSELSNTCLVLRAHPVSKPLIEFSTAKPQFYTTEQHPYRSFFRPKSNDARLEIDLMASVGVKILHVEFFEFRNSKGATGICSWAVSPKCDTISLSNFMAMREVKAHGYTGPFYMLLRCTLSTPEGTHGYVFQSPSFDYCSRKTTFYPPDDSFRSWSAGIMREEKISIIGRYEIQEGESDDTMGRLAKGWSGFPEKGSLKKLCADFVRIYFGRKITERAQELTHTLCSPSTTHILTSTLIAQDKRVLAACAALCIEMSRDICMNILDFILSVPTVDLQPAFLSAVCHKDLQIAARLVDFFRVDIAFCEDLPYFCASFNNDAPMVKLLLDRGSNPNASIYWAIQLSQQRDRKENLVDSYSTQSEGEEAEEPIQVAEKHTEEIRGELVEPSTLSIPPKPTTETVNVITAHFRFCSAPLQVLQRASYTTSSRRIHLVDGSKDVIIGNQCECKLRFRKVTVEVELPDCIEGSENLEFFPEERQFTLPPLIFMTKKDRLTGNSPVVIYFHITGEAIDPSGSRVCVKQTLHSAPFIVCSNPNRRRKTKTIRKNWEIPMNPCQGCQEETQKMIAKPSEAKDSGRIDRLFVEGQRLNRPRLEVRDGNGASTWNRTSQHG